MTISFHDLQRENMELRHAIGKLMASNEDHSTPLPCQLTISQEIIARFLRKRSPNPVSREAIHAELYAFRHEADQPNIKTIDVLIWQVRKRLLKVGITVTNDFGRGWFLDAAAAKRWDQLAATR